MSMVQATLRHTCSPTRHRSAPTNRPRFAQFGSPLPLRRPICTHDRSLQRGTSIKTSVSTAPQGLETELDARGSVRLALRKEGWQYWTWQSESGPIRTHYIEAGDASNPPVLLIHGFGASSYHYRHNIPELSQRYHVLALDMAGFGWSDKPLANFEDGELWVAQAAAFLRHHGVGPSRKAVVAGNSLGGYVTLALAVKHPELVAGIALLNSAGSFESETSLPPPEFSPVAQLSLWGRMRAWLGERAKRVVVGASFYYTKQPLRIRQVLRAVYVNHAQVDDDLVDSIQLPSEDPNAPEVFYRIITQKKRPVNSLLQQLRVPTLLLWGLDDPWIVPRRTDQIIQCYPAAVRVDIPGSGHCPHDDTPEVVNRELSKWADQLARSEAPA